MRPILLLALIVTASVAPAARTPLETVRLPGLIEPVEILRDRWGINPIYANHEADLFFAQGYSAARDRLFQFEIWRRQATGTAAEVFGRRELKRDIGARRHQSRGDMKQERLLVYTKNGTGYVHDNIPASIEAIRELGRDHGFAVDASNDPAVFTDDTLKQYSAVLFSNTNNVVFDTDAQRVALMRYVQAGGGFVAIHSASGTERGWTWFAGLLGGAFSRHAPFQKFGVLILDRTHPSLAHLPERWEREDECYYLVRMNVNMQILAVNDLTSVLDPKGKPATFGDVFPSVWYQEFDGGRQWYTSLGHRKEDYGRPDFRRHLLGGIRSVVRHAPLDYTRAYAVSPEDGPRRR